MIIYRQIYDKKHLETLFSRTSPNLLKTNNTHPETSPPPTKLGNELNSLIFTLNNKGLETIYRRYFCGNGNKGHIRFTPRVFILALLFCLWSAPAFAQGFGIAMHGSPKYVASDTHLTYANADAPKGGNLKEAAIGTFDTINPYSIKGKAAKGLNLVYDRLMARVWDEPFTMYPLIAQSIEVAEDRSSITVHINPKARFHDGRAITAEDVIFSFETLRDSGRPNMRQIYKLVETVEKRGDLSVHFKFGEGFDRETVMIIAMMPVLSKVWWKDREFDSTTLDIPNLNGPYRIKSIDAGRAITYERVKDYWAADLLTNVGHHNFDIITKEYYRDDSVAFEAFKAGDLDIRREWNMGKWASAYDFPRAASGDVALESLPHGRPERTKGFIFNTRRAPFDDISVRKAFDLLFDFEWANQNLFHGRYKRIQSFFPNSELAAQGTPSAEELNLLAPWKDKIDPAIFGDAYQAPIASSRNQYRVNLRKANTLLNKAGWVVKDGKRVKNGEELDFEIMLSAPEDEKIALHFKRSLEKMGISVTIRVLDTAAYRGRLNEYDFDMTLYYWLSSLSPGTEQILYWGCDAANQPARWNFPGICDEAIDAISLDIAATQKREDLLTHMHALDRLLTHGHYMVPLYYAGTDQIAYSSFIKRPNKTPLYGLVQETWWMDTQSP